MVPEAGKCRSKRMAASEAGGPMRRPTWRLCFSAADERESAQRRRPLRAQLIHVPIHQPSNQ